MHDRKPLISRAIFIVLLLWLMNITGVLAQSRSRIAGYITDVSTGKPLLGVNVMVEGTYLGAASDMNGQYIIINVPVGTYSIRASMMGYEGMVMTNVMVSADRVSKVDFQMVQTVIEGSVVTVTAVVNVLHKEVSNTQMVVSDIQLQDASGIREINSFLTKLPGVSEDNGYLTIRGGSADQTGMMLNGLSYMNAAVGNAETSIPMSAIEQVSLLSGGYNAEYGNFRSGLINITTKSGSQSGYHGTFTYSRDQAHIRHYGKSFYDPYVESLRPYFDPDVAFVGTLDAWADDPYTTQQYPRFDGWIKAANNFNIGKEPENYACAMDYYLLGSWMHMAVPDYEGLADLSDELKQEIGYYEVSAEQKKLFENHHNTEKYPDWNFDGGFGGPLPFIGEKLGNATFYISHNAKKQHYVMPVSRSNEEKYTTLATIKMQPLNNLTVTLNGLHKKQIGVSPIRPPWGDFPDASREGGFMPINNVKYIAKNPEYWYDQPFFPILEQRTLMGGVTINHVLSKSTFWELSLSAMDIQDSSPTGDTRDSTAITHFGPFPVTEMPYGKLLYGGNRVIGIFDGDTINYNYPSYDALPGIARRFRRKEGDLFTNVNIRQYRAKFDITSQIGFHHYLKGGIEYNYIDLNHELWQMWNENYYNVYEFNYHRTPSQTGIYVQDQISYEGIVANLGLRFDYYYGGGGKWPTGDPFNTSVFTPWDVPSDSAMFEALEAGASYIWDRWVRYDSLNPGFMQPIKNHMTISPRIGISFPVTERAKFYFNYGHFRSNPPYYSMYLYRYRYTKNGLYDMSNPNLDPPRTISYELGMQYNFHNGYLLGLSGYSKDVTGQHGEVTYKSATGSLNYDMWTNNEYEDIQGVELTLSKTDNSWIVGWVNFNYMLKKDGKTGREEITEVPASDDREGLYAGQETRSLPRPRVNGNVTMRSPQNWGPKVAGVHPLANWNVTFFGEWEAGRYFTWNPLNNLHVDNNMRWPQYYMVDLKLTKKFKFLGVEPTFFIDVNNVLNLKVSLLHRGYAFQRDTGDMEDWRDYFNYMGSLRLPMYDSDEFDTMREQYPGYFIPGDDKVGDFRSLSLDEDKLYINNPNYTFWLYEQPRDIWFGIRFNF